MRKFQFLAVTPTGLIDPSIAIAASRAGELGVLNLEHIKEEQIASAAVAKLARFARKGCGLKLNGADEHFISRLNTDIPKQINLVILTYTNLDTLRQQVKTFHDKNIKILLEVTSLDKALTGAEAGVDGLIAKGNEAGGWVEQETTFILLQLLVSQMSLPVLAQGGIGLHTQLEHPVWF